jgi:protein-disulfide isomerase
MMILRRAVFVLLACVAAALPVARAEILTPPQQEAIRTLVRNYLLAHPEIIIEALAGLEERQKAEAASSQAQALRARRADLQGDPASPWVGSTEPDLVIIEFFDYRCQYCKQVVSALTQLVASDAKLRVVYKELPILGPDSELAARAALAAHRQGRYARYHAALMARRGPFDEATLLALAGEHGLDTTRLKADMARSEIGAQIDRNRALARELGIRGTPAFVIGETIVPGAIDLETMRGLVAQARRR